MAHGNPPGTMFLGLIEELMDLLKDPHASVSVFAWWQVRIAREKLRHDLYDRRFSIYMAFHELLVAILEKTDVDPELRKANAARAHSPFLLDAKLGGYLEKLHAEAFRINATNKLVFEPNLITPEN